MYSPTNNSILSISSPVHQITCVHSLWSPSLSARLQHRKPLLHCPRCSPSEPPLIFHFIAVTISKQDSLKTTFKKISADLNYDRYIQPKNPAHISKHAFVSCKDFLCFFLSSYSTKMETKTFVPFTTETCRKRKVSNIAKYKRDNPKFHKQDVGLKYKVFWDVLLCCSIVSSRCFERKFCLHFQAQSLFLECLTLKMKAPLSFESFTTIPIYLTTPH